jgi:hypothetical protein
MFALVTYRNPLISQYLQIDLEEEFPFLRGKTTVQETLDNSYSLYVHGEKPESSVIQFVRIWNRAAERFDKPF